MDEIRLVGGHRALHSASTSLLPSSSFARCAESFPTFGTNARLRIRVTLSIDDRKPGLIRLMAMNLSVTTVQVTNFLRSALSQNSPPWRTSESFADQAIVKVPDLDRDIPKQSATLSRTSQDIVDTNDISRRACERAGLLRNYASTLCVTEHTR